MSQYFPDIAWRTILSNVRVDKSNEFHYLCWVNPEDPNEPGADPVTVDDECWVIDYAGYTYEVENVNIIIVEGKPIYELTIYDINERVWGTNYIGPTPNMEAYVYKPKNGAFLLTQAQLRYLDKSAMDKVYPVEKGVLWGHRGVKITTDDVEEENVTELELEGFALEEMKGVEGWRGGKRFRIFGSNIPPEHLMKEVEQEGHGFNMDFIYFDGTEWVKAIADDIDACATHFAMPKLEKVLVEDEGGGNGDDGETVYEYVPNEDVFILIPVGELELGDYLDGSDGGLVDGSWYYLSQEEPGKVTRNRPRNGVVQAVMRSNINGHVTIAIQPPHLHAIGGRNYLTHNPDNWASGYLGILGIEAARNYSVRMRNYIPVEAGAVYTIQHFTNVVSTLVVRFFDSSKNGIVHSKGTISTLNSRSNTFIIEDGMAFIRVYFNGFEGTPINPNQLGVDIMGKLEKGNVPTDWSPAWEDLVVTIPSIGATNYLKYSEFKGTVEGNPTNYFKVAIDGGTLSLVDNPFRDNSLAVSATSNGGCAYLKIGPDQSTGQNGLIRVKVGDTITISVSASNNNTWCWLVGSASASTGWSTYTERATNLRLGRVSGSRWYNTYTITNENTNYIRLYRIGINVSGGTNNYSNIFADIKMEKSEIPSDWSPHTSDISNDVTGSGSDGRLAYWTGSKSLGSSANLTWSDNMLSVKGVARVYNPVISGDVAGDREIEFSRSGSAFGTTTWRDWKIKASGSQGLVFEAGLSGTITTPMILSGGGNLTGLNNITAGGLGKFKNIFLENPDARPFITFKRDTYSEFNFSMGYGRLSIDSESNLYLLTIAPDGKTGIGLGNDATGPTQMLDVKGKIRMRTQTAAGDGNDIVATKKYVDDSISIPSIDPYSAITSSTWNCTTGLNKTWSISSNSTLSITNLSNGMSGDLMLTVSGTRDLTLSIPVGYSVKYVESAIEFSSNKATLGVGTYHLTFACGSNWIHFNIAKYS